MANQLILPPQKFRYRDITDQFPATGIRKKKVFFQAELRSLADGNASFGIVAYPSWKDGNTWVVGNKVTGADTGGQPAVVPLTGPVAFANNEVLLSLTLLKKNKKENPRKGRWSALMKIIQKNCKKGVTSDKITLIFEAGVSKNPHLEYNVTLDLGGTVLSVPTKPSPPAPPES
ncbi:MAG: hypothetical protein ACT4OJ_00870 [Bacteroidota bacterium]